MGAGEGDVDVVVYKIKKKRPRPNEVKVMPSENTVTTGSGAPNGPGIHNVRRHLAHGAPDEPWEMLKQRVGNQDLESQSGLPQAAWGRRREPEQAVKAEEERQIENGGLAAGLIECSRYTQKGQ